MAPLLPLRTRPLRPAARAAASVVALLSLALPGCGGGGEGGGGGSGSTLSGRLSFPAAASLSRRTEVERNDSIDTATELGTLVAGDRLSVEGSTSALDGSDPFDGYTVTLPSRVRVRATVTALDASRLDPDLHVYDPTALQVVGSFTSDGPIETATFVAKGSTQLVVRAASGEGRYRLELLAESLGGPLAALEAGRPTLCGDVLPGDAVAGSAAPGATGAFVVACPAACVLDVEAHGADGAAAALAWSDGTEDLGRARLFGTGAGSGRLDVEAGTLVRIEVGAGATETALVLRASAPAARTARARVEAARRVASLDLEAFAWRPATDARYGRPAHEITPGRAIVKSHGEAAASLGRRACRVREAAAESTSVVEFDVPSSLGAVDGARSTWARIHGLRSSGDFSWAEPSGRRRIRKTPNDPRYAEQWHYPAIRLPEAWDLTTGSTSVRVAVIDTGSTAHPDLAGRFVDGYDFISDVPTAGDGDGRDGDATDVGDSEAGEPSSFHGTHVSGTIGATTNDGRGVAGVCWAVSIMPLRVLGIGGGDDADIIAAIRYAAGLSNASGRLPSRRADVINMSLGGGGFDQAMQDAITAARNAGVVIFAASGNDGSSAAEYPAAFAGVISVGATNRGGTVASYSNRGATLDIVAPGGDSSASEANGILSTVFDDSSGTPVAGYAFYDGTSMATPHAAGVAALVLAAKPGLTPAQVESILLSSAKDLGTAGRDNTYGYGLVDAYAAVKLALDGVVPPPPPEPPPSPTPTPGANEDVYVLVVDVDTDEAVLETVVAAGGASWRIEGVPAGRFAVYAGSDLDEDGYIGGEGELSGWVGSSVEPDVLDVDGFSALTGLDVVLDRVGAFASARARLRVAR